VGPKGIDEVRIETRPRYDIDRRDGHPDRIMPIDILQPVLDREVAGTGNPYSDAGVILRTVMASGTIGAASAAGVPIGGATR
jgi:hypothetical protein